MSKGESREDTKLSIENKRFFETCSQNSLSESKLHLIQSGV